MKLDCSFVFAVSRPVIRGKTQRYGRAVYGIERIVETKAVTRGKLSTSAQEFFEQCFKHRWVASIHGIRQCRFGDRLHAEMVKTRFVRQKPITDFTQGILSCNLSIETSKKLSPGTEMLAVPVSTARINGFFKTMSGYELEKLRKDGIVMHGSRSRCLN